GGGSQRLPRLIGARRAKELMLLGGWLSAAEALAWGLVNRVAPAGTVTAVVEEIAATLAAGSASANRTVKALVNRAFDAELGEGLALERRLVALHMRSADAAEGLRAFAEKRKPVF
ncbi:MAG TPA: enoyl-CoA hydratase-related protein, partial [Methylomirabilota bacterium]|nr:enoyl-CoA hydratase-related protein [Methylomirabilota bacterium]